MIARAGLGAILLAAAVLKLTGGSGEIARNVLPYFSTRLYMAGIVFEAILGAWLLAGLAPVHSWLMSLGFFGLLAYMSFQLGITGQSSCGCLGRVKVNPWWAFAVDLTAIAALVAWRPSNIRGQLRAGWPVVIGSAAVVVLALGVAVGRYGSPDAAWAHLRGQPVAVRPSFVAMGSGKVDDIRDKEVWVTNYSAHPVRIAHCASDCSCVVALGLPVDIPAGEGRAVPVRLRFIGAPGRFRKQLTLYAQDDRVHVMPVVVTGKVID